MATVEYDLGVMTEWTESEQVGTSLQIQSLPVILIKIFYATHDVTCVSTRWRHIGE